MSILDRIGGGAQIDKQITKLNERVSAIEKQVGATGDALDLGGDTERQIEYPHFAGIVVRVHTDLDGLSVRLSEMTRRAHSVRLVDSSGNVLAEEDTTLDPPGTWITLECDLNGGNTYQVLAGPDERNLARGKTAVDYPVEGDDLSVTAGAYTNGDNTSDTYRYCFSAVAPGTDFEDRVRHWSAIDDVPPSAELVPAREALDFSGDVGAEVQAWLDGLDTANHCLVMPFGGSYEWNTYASAELLDSEFVGIVAPEGATATYHVGECIDQPLYIGSYGDGPREAIIRNLRWDITGTDPGGWPVDTGFLRVGASECAIVEGCRRIGRRSRYQLRDGEGPYDGFYDFGDAYSMKAAVSPGGAGVIRANYNAGGIHHAIAEEPGNHGEGVGFSAEGNRGAIDWLGNVDDGSVGNVFYMHSPTSDESHNYLAGNSISDHCRCAIRLGANDVARDCYVQMADTEDRYYSTGVWFNHGHPLAEDIEIDAPNGNHELVRDTSDGGTLRDTRVYAGPDNDSFSLRSNSPTVVEDCVFVDESDEWAGPDWPGALHFNDPGAVLRRVTIDVSNSPRDPWSGEDPELVDCEIID